VEVRSREEFERAFDIIADARLEGIMAPQSGLVAQSRQRRPMRHQPPRP
jgi:hypothetical protein